MLRCLVPVGPRIKQVSWYVARSGRLKPPRVSTKLWYELLVIKAFSRLITLLERNVLWFPWRIGTEEMDGGAERDSVELCSFTHESRVKVALSARSR